MSRCCEPPPQPALELYVRYFATVEEMAFGRIPREALAKILASGRQCGVLLEYEIAEIFSGTEKKGKQGPGEDLIDVTIGKIQCKTYRRSSEPGALFASGPDKGRIKISRADIWTTKSGYWDRRNRMTEEDHERAEEYFGEYDAFMYIDISCMEAGKYSFVTVSSGDVVRWKDGYNISEDAINSLVVRTEVLLPGHSESCSAHPPTVVLE